MIQSVHEDGLCISCGTCVGICPVNAITLQQSKDGMYEPIVDRFRCIGCGLCVRVCPGLSFISPGKDTGPPTETFDAYLGKFVNCYIGHADDEGVLERASSGGLITSILILALEEKIIDGAIVIKMKRDDPLEPEVFIARTREELILAAGSKYCPVPINAIIKEILKLNGKFAFVGLPCHIYGIKQAEMINEKLRKMMILHLGLFCSHIVNFTGTKFFLSRMNIGINAVDKFDYRSKGWPGGITIRLKDGSEKFIKYRFWGEHFFEPYLFTPYRCMMCDDNTNEMADISFGDAWLPQLMTQGIGWSIVATRTREGDALFKRTASRGKTRIIRADHRSLIWSQRYMAVFKKKNIRAKIRVFRLFHKRVPGGNLREIIKPALLAYPGTIFLYMNLYFTSKGLRFLQHVPLPLFKMYNILIHLLNMM